MKVFFIAQHVSNVITFILRSWRLYVGILLCFDVYWCNGAVRLKHCSNLHSDTTLLSRTAKIHQYTPKQSSTPTYSRQLLRMNVTAFETCWAIKKTFIKWYQVGSIYSTSKMMHGPINIRYTSWRPFYCPLDPELAPPIAPNNPVTPWYQNILRQGAGLLDGWVVCCVALFVYLLVC